MHKFLQKIVKIYLTASLVFTSSDVGSLNFIVSNNQVTVLVIPDVQTDNTSTAICDLHNSSYPVYPTNINHKVSLLLFVLLVGVLPPAYKLDVQLFTASWICLQQ